MFRREHVTHGRAFATMDRLLDRALSGPKFLALPEIASLVCETLSGQSGFELHAFVVMPNHVHMLASPLLPLPSILRKLKGGTAFQANRLLNRTGMPFWQEESYDHVVRNERSFWRIVRYIEENPMRAGLVNAPDQYSWSSAGIDTKS